jgi:hypothetical protein
MGKFLDKIPGQDIEAYTILNQPFMPALIIVDNHLKAGIVEGNKEIPG